MGPVQRAFLLLAVLVFAGSATASTLRPAVTIVRTTPVLSVRGAHFRPAERVRVVLNHDGARTTRFVRASQQGAFVASLGSLLPFDPCSDAFSVLAIGSSGERTTVKFVPRECPPAP